MKRLHTITLLGLLVGTIAVAQEPTLPTPPVKPPKGQAMTVLLDDFTMIRCRVEIDDKDGTYHLYDGDIERDLPAKRVLFAGTSDAEVRYYMLMSAKQNAKSEKRDRATLASSQFTTKVQPVLVNLCVSCHAQPQHKDGFHLQFVRLGFASPDATLHNAEAASRYVDTSNPNASPLLVKAQQIHGGQQRAAMPGPQHPAFRHLQLWAITLAPPQAVAPAVTLSPLANLPKPVWEPVPEATPTTPQIVDPYDPTPFNQRH